MFGLADIIQIQERIIYNHGQKSLGQSERNFNSMRFTSSVAKSSAVFLQIHVPSPLLTQYNVERSKELCLDGFNTVCGVGGVGRDVQCQQRAGTIGRVLKSVRTVQLSQDFVHDCRSAPVVVQIYPWFKNYLLCFEQPVFLRRREKFRGYARALTRGEKERRLLSPSRVPLSRALYKKLTGKKKNKQKNQARLPRTRQC